jgi:hypothetical protein
MEVSMDVWRKGTTACQKTTEACLKEAKAGLEEMEAVGDVF